MELPIYLVYLCIVVISIVILSPKIHVGLICTVGLSMMAIGFLGLALQNHELGSTQFGTSGQWQSIKYGSIVALLGYIFKIARRKHEDISKPRELKPNELHQVRGRGE